VANREPLVDEVAAAILDGSPIDWTAVDSASTGVNRGLIHELRLVSAVADLHRRPPGVRDAAVTDVWGHLRLLERVGAGSFGEVYRAHDTRLDREVAVKLMPAAGSDAAGIAGVIREGRLLARVQDPGVVTVYDAQQVGDRVGLWMEFVRGRTLEERLEQEGICTVAEAIDIGVELCRAVAAVHEAGLLHRDIKTQNVMRRDDGRLVLMDFGVGREVADGTGPSLAGTPLYLAPEILRGLPATARTDVYAIGVLLFRLLTGSFPVRAAVMADLRRAHETGDRQPLLDARPDLPADLAAVVERAAHSDPDRRYGGAAELADALEAARPRVRSHRGWLAAAAAAVLVAGAAFSIDRGWIAIGQGAGRVTLNPQQWILIGEFNGSTGDTGLDAALRQAVTGELEASSYVNVFPTPWVRESLGRMARPATSRLDEPLALELARREGLAAVVAGSVDAQNGTYRLSMRATHVATGRVLVIPTEAHQTRQAALQAAFALGRRMREMLGESRSSIQATSATLMPVTSESVDAMRDFALGRALLEEERGKDAVPHFLEAVGRDPEFAMAYLYLAQAYSYPGEYGLRQAALDRAAALARSADGRMSAIEREKILADYHAVMERFLEAAAHVRKALDLRPGDARLLTNLGVIYGSLRQYGPAIDAFESAMRSYPHPRVRWMLADMYSASGRPDDAVALVGPHLDGPGDWIAYAKHLAIAGNRPEAAAALAEAERRADQSAGGSWADLALAKADLLRSEGRFDAAEAVLQQGLDRADRPLAERLELAMTSLLLDAGRRAEAITHVRRIDVGLARNRIVHGVLAARAGGVAIAGAILERLEEEAADRQAPRPDARVHQLRAEIAIARDEPRLAHEHAVQAVRAFTTTWTLETLARAQEALGQTDVALATWTSILDRPGERTADWDAPAYAQVVLTRYRLARLLERAGQTDRARDAYDEFLRLWARADADLRPYADARARRVALGSARPGRF
jgi:tetratricopeptide (TPR) repeat protein